MRYNIHGQVREATATREVIVSTGAINSPQLLELSGIGQPDRLKGLGLEVKHELKGVGENLRDHWAPRTKWKTAHRGVTYNEKARGLRGMGEGIRYILTQKGFLALPASPLRAFFKTREGLASPDAMLMLQPFLVTPDVKLDREVGITVLTHQQRPESKGSIHVTSTDATRPPAVKFNFLSDQIDRDCIVAAIRTVRKVVNASPLAWLEPKEMGPGTNLQSDDELIDWVTRNAETAYHPVGTCKMGTDTDPMAVVDDRLRVRGLEGLRVADASIMPTLTSGNTNAPSIMIGEKCARMVLETASAA